MSITELPYRLLALLLTIVLTFGGGYCAGQKSAESAQLRDQLAAAQQIVATEHAQQAVSASSAAAYETAAAQERVVYQTITKEVIRYVQASHPACTLDADWVRLHNTAAVSVFPAAASQPHAAAASATAADALITVTDNYSVCAANATRLKALQAWVSAQQNVKP